MTQGLVTSSGILGDPGAVSRVDKMFVVKVYCKIDLTVNFHNEHFIDPTNCPWVSEDTVVALTAKNGNDRLRERNRLRRYFTNKDYYLHNNTVKIHI